MSNLPVLWVPPVPPPDPDERPPKRRGNKGVLLAAVAILATPLLAVAVFGENAKSGDAPVRAATVEPAAPTPAATPARVEPKAAPLKLAAQDEPAAAPASVGPAPDTSGGNQPYIAAPIPQTKADAASAETARAVGPDGRPVRVIGLDRRAEDREPAVVPPAEKKPAAAAAPAAPAAALAPAVVETAPAKPAEAIEAATPRGTITEPAERKAETPPVAAPATPTVVKADPAPAPATTPTPTVSAEPKAAETAPVAPKPVEAKPVEAKTEPKSTEPKAVEVARPSAPETVKVPLPPKRETAARSAPATGKNDFADRLAAIRRAESRRAVEAAPPPVYEDEEVIVVEPPRPRRWGFIPPFFDSGPRGPVLRPFEEPPPREAMRRAPQAENCHYHAWPTEDMAFHRTVRCHWHRDAGDPSIRYVR